MLKWIAYYVIHIGANIAAVLLLRESTEISAGSLCPIAVMAIMLLQALLAFYKSDGRGETAFSDGNRLTSADVDSLNWHLKVVFLIILPFCLPFVFFFPLYAKLLTILLYLLSYIIAGVSFKLIYGKRISARIDGENAELREQRKKEEHGET